MPAAAQPQAAARSTLAAQVASQAARPQPVRPASGPALVRPAAAAILAPGQLSTAELWSQAQSATTRLRNSLIEVSYTAWQLHARADWTALGLADETAAAEELGLGEAAWRQHLRLGERLVASGLTLEQLRSLTIESARLLSRVHPDLWHEFPWIDEARMLSSRQFAALVEDRLQQHGGSGLSLRESRATVAVSLPSSQAAAVETRLGKLRHLRHASSNGEVLTQALTALEQRSELEAKLAALTSQVASLAALWPNDLPWAADKQESPAEREARYQGDPAAASLTEAAHASQKSISSLQRTLKEIHAVLS